MSQEQDVVLPELDITTTSRKIQYLVSDFHFKA